MLFGPGTFQEMEKIYEVLQLKCVIRIVVSSEVDGRVRHWCVIYCFGQTVTGK